MARKPAPSCRPPAGVKPVADSVPRALDNLALFVLLLVVSMRTLLSETYESGLSGISHAIGDTASLTPATTVMFDVAIGLAAAMAAFATLLRRQPWRWTGIEAGWAMMVVAAVVSCCAAGNKRLAINASCDWLTALVLTITLANLLRERRRVVLVLSVVVASGLASATKCGSQLGWEFADTWEAYQQQKPEFWAQQGIAATDPTVALFERRMLAREATGFLPYSNAQGAGLVLAGFAGITLTFLSGRSRTAKGVCGVVAAVILASVVATGSRGAMLAALIGLALLIAGTLIGSAWHQRWKALWAGLWITAAIGVALVIVWGTTRGRLPGDSLRFRWEYWQVTSEIVAEHPWTGVGALNFDRAYLKYKPVQYPEEIRDPHNFAMAIVSQWGVIGGVGMIIALLGGSWVAIRMWGQETSPPQHLGAGLFSFKGRMRRLGYWATTITITLIGDVLHFMFWEDLPGAYTDTSAGPTTIVSRLALYFLLLLPTFWIGLATQVKRWHDRGRSGWMVLVAMIPVIGWIWAIIELGFLKGTTGPNDYGEDPLGLPVARRPAQPLAASLGGWVAAIIVGFILLRLWMLRGWLLSGEAGVATVFFDLFLYGTVWCLAFLGVSLLLSFTWGEAGTASPSPSRQAVGPHSPSLKAHQQPSPPYQGGGRGGDRYRLPCLIALGVFLLHNTIDFSLFVPGTLTTFAALAAVAAAWAAERETEGPRNGVAWRWGAMIVSLGGLLAVIMLLVLPVLRCTSGLKKARAAAVTGSGDPAPFYEAAAEADPLDPTPLTEWASWAAHTGGVPGLDKALNCLQMAQNRDPQDRGIYRSQWRVLELRYEAAGNPADLREAVAAAEKALELYPQSPDGHVDLARLLARAASEIRPDPASGIPGRDWLADAIQHYDRALELDADRPWYEIRRWHKDRRLQIEGQLTQLKAMMETRPAD